jgi:hypothetical protein
VTHSDSLNWSGYAAVPGTFTEASATWTQPAVTCASNETSYSSVWVGIDGDGSSTVEQTGTEADCSSGQARYYAWTEMYPKFPSVVSSNVSAGDQLSAKVTTSRGFFTLVITDSSKGWSFTTTAKRNSAALYSAEVIVEAPSSRSGVLPLADFGTVNISAAMANNSPIGGFAPNLDTLTMVTSGGTVKAKPSSLSSSGTAFSVAWQHA